MPASCGKDAKSSDSGAVEPNHIVDSKSSASTLDLDPILSRSLRLHGQDGRCCDPNRLPNELFQHIASMLPPRDLFRSALVCRSWRAVLFSAPHLWTVVSVSCRAWAGIACWAPLLATLFPRSEQLPLHVELESLHALDTHLDNLGSPKSLDAPPPLARRAFLDVLLSQMHRIKTLSLSATHPVLMLYIFYDILTAEAPALECFRCIVYPEVRLVLPHPLFANAAPRLREVYLSHVSLPDKDCPVLRHVTDLHYDMHIIEDRDINSIIDKLTSLRRLTIVGHPHGSMGHPHALIPSRAARCTLPLDLRITNQLGVDGILRCFENAASICLNSVISTCWDPDALTKLLKSTPRVTSIDIDFQPIHLELTGVDGVLEGGAVCIKLNGVKVAVDLLDSEVIDAIRASCPTILRELRSLTVLQELWFLFSEQELPILDELTIYIVCDSDLHSDSMVWAPDELLDNDPAPHLHRVATLRLKAVWGGATLAEADVAEFIRVTFDTRVLHTLVLCGGSLDHHAEQPLHSLLPHLRILHEWPGDPDSNFEPWSWTFSSSEALHV